MHKKLGWFVLAGLVLVAGCAVETATSATTQNAIGPATITTDKAAYNYNDTVTITFAGLNGNVKDWIAIAPQGSALTTVTQWTYTGGGTSGSTSLVAPPVGGTFVARAFDNDTFTLMGESDPFTTTDPGTIMVTVTTDKSQYAMTDKIIVTWSGLPGSAKDWISLAPNGSPATTTTDWLYTGGGTSGSLTFDGIGPTGYPPGAYVARAFLNDTFTQVGQSAVFNVGGTCTTNKSSYATFEPIVVTWTNLPGDPTDWVALAPSGSPATTITSWQYSGGAANGSTTFVGGLATPGTYVARTFERDSYVMGAECAPFTVSSGATVSVTTDLSAYTLGQVVTVTWSGLPGNPNDWIALAPNGSSDTTVTRWVYTAGAVNGSYTFEGPGATGTYVARAFQNDLYVKLGQSAAFTVN